MKPADSMWTRFLPIVCAAVLSSCERKQVVHAPQEDLRPLIQDVEVAADEFDRLWTEAKLADVAADLRALSTQPTMTKPPSLKAEKENKKAEDARLKLRELSAALEEKLRSQADGDVTNAFFKRMDVRRRIEGLTADLGVRSDRNQIMEELRKARLELDALRPQFDKAHP